MRIGNIEIENKVVLAPMAGISNKAFRLIAKEFGVGLLITEMVSDNAIIYRNKKTLEMLEVDEIEKPISIQLFGGNKSTLAEAAKYVDDNTKADIIDINMGCPVPKVVKNGGGSKWLLYPDKIEEAIEEIVKAVKKPVTVKMRIGWDSEHINAIENAKRIEHAGASAIAVHGRTREQMYTGKANWDEIRKVKEAVNIPVIGNGDIKSPEDAKSMIETTGVDAVMIGRAALGNPWILYRTAKYLQTGVLISEPDIEEKMKVAFIHMDRLIKLKGEEIGVKEMRKHAGWYLKGLPASSTIREKIYEMNTKDEMYKLFEAYMVELKNNTII